MWRLATLAWLLISAAAFGQSIEGGGAPAVTPPVFVPGSSGPACAGFLGSLSGTANNAYAVCKINSSFAGNAIHVTRTSDSTGSNIGFNGDGSLNTTTLSSFCAATTCGVDTFYDQVGSANVTQTTAANQPEIVISGTTQTINSVPAPLCVNASSRFWDATPASQAQPYTVALTINNTSTGWVGSAHWHDGSSGARTLIGATSGPAYQLYAGGTPGSGGTVDTNTTHSLVAVLNGASSVLYVDAASTISGTNVGTNGYNGSDSYHICASIGGAAVDSYLPMFIIFSSSLSSGDRAAIHTASKYWGGS